jgi:hypothetical protein
MAEKSTLLKTFNSHLFEFIDDVIRIFPENKDIQTAKLSFQTIKKANPTAIVKVWYSYLYIPYREQIDSGDIHFFFQKDYSEDLSPLANSKEIIKIIDTLRGPVSNMNDIEKGFTIKYVQNLSKISMLYNSS